MYLLHGMILDPLGAISSHHPASACKSGKFFFPYGRKEKLIGQKFRIA